MLQWMGAERVRHDLVTEQQMSGLFVATSPALAVADLLAMGDQHIAREGTVCTALLLQANLIPLPPAIHVVCSQ